MEELQENKFLIPVDGAIRDFRRHLLSHPRTILSAAYGDGKSFFMQQFMANKEIQDQFVFLTLFPVNYQVVENRDVFDFIKYDLIFQLFKAGLIDSQESLSNKILAQWFIMTQGKSIVSFAAKICAMIGVEYEEFASAATVFDSLPYIIELRDKYNTFRNENSDNDGDINSFIRTIDEHYLYESDSVTAFIRDAIADYKEKYPEKKIVLIVEDMDRLDPAHIFRILNILSAHVDYAYRYGLSPSKNTVTGNKFGVDNILLVMDYENTKNIYSHFYGENANFEGYINKFISHGIFQYSLTEEKSKYFTNYLYQDTHIKERIIQEMIPDVFYRGKTIREIFAAVENTANQLYEVPPYMCFNEAIELPKGILQLMVVLRRLGKTDEEVAENVERVIAKYPYDMMYYLGGYWLVYHNGLPLERVYVKKKGDEYSLELTINDIRKSDGTAILSNERDDVYTNHSPSDMQSFIYYLLSFIAKSDSPRKRTLSNG